MGGSFWEPVALFSRRWLILVPVVHFGVPFSCWWCVLDSLGLHFGAGGPFWDFILVPVVRFGAPFWCRFWGSILVPVVRCGISFWSVLGLHFGASGSF